MEAFREYVSFSFSEANPKFLFHTFDVDIKGI